MRFHFLSSCARALSSILGLPCCPLLCFFLSPSLENNPTILSCPLSLFLHITKRPLHPYTHTSYTFPAIIFFFFFLFFLGQHGRVGNSQDARGGRRSAPSQGRGPRADQRCVPPWASGVSSLAVLLAFLFYILFYFLGGGSVVVVVVFFSSTAELILTLFVFFKNSFDERS